MSMISRTGLGSPDLVEAIRLKIIFHDIKPNASISEDALANEFGVSRTPIREALVILQTNRLVMIERNYGAYVRGNSFAAFKNFLEAAKLVTPETFALAAVRRTDANLESLETLLREAEALGGAENFKQRLICLRSFIFEAVSACQNALLTEEVQRFTDLHIFFRIGVVLSLAPGQLEQHIENIDDHRSIYEHLRNRAAENARVIAENRLERTRRLMLNILA